MMHYNGVSIDPYTRPHNLQPLSFERSTASSAGLIEPDLDSTLKESAFRLRPVFDAFKQGRDTGYHPPCANPPPEIVPYYPERPLFSLKPLNHSVTFNGGRRPVRLTRTTLLCPITVPSRSIGTGAQLGAGQGSYSFPSHMSLDNAFAMSSDARGAERGNSFKFSPNIGQDEPSLSSGQVSKSQSEADTIAFPIPKARVKQFVEFTGKSSHKWLYNGSKLYRNCFGNVHLYVPINTEIRTIAIGEKIPFTSMDGDNPQCRWGSCTTYIPRSFMGFEEHLLLHMPNLKDVNSKTLVPCLWRGCEVSITKKNLYAHIVSVHMAKFYNCRWCERTYFDEDDMRTHASYHHAERIQKFLEAE